MAAAALQRGIDMTAPVTLFTRSGVDAADNRGSSMVDKHREKLKKEKEEAALAALQQAVPHVGIGVCVLALEGTAWEAEAAVKLLQSFEVDKGPQLAAIQQKRRELEAIAASPVATDSPSDDSDSDSGRERKRSKKHKGSKGKRSKHKKEKSRSKKKHRASRKNEGSGVEGVVKTGYGAYGIIREQDFFDKRSEFQAWAIDVKKADIEIMPKAEEKELFKSFAEDFNTATLPHEKYYNLDIYERKKAAEAARKGSDNVPAEKTAFQDEQDRRAELAEQRRVAEAERLRDAYNQLKFTAVGKADDMREQELMRMQMQQAYRLGDSDLAGKLKGRLKPDEPVWCPPPPPPPAGSRMAARAQLSV